MSATPLPAPVLAALPDLVRRLAIILAGLAAQIAHSLLRDPKRVGFIVPLYYRILRAARRFERLTLRLAAGEPARPARPGRRGGKPPVRLPQAHGWLAAVGWQVRGYGCQLEYLLSDPAMVELLAAEPRAVRIFRPLCRLLGLRPAALPPLPRRPPRAARRQATAYSTRVCRN